MMITLLLFQMLSWSEDNTKALVRFFGSAHQRYTNILSVYSTMNALPFRSKPCSTCLGGGGGGGGEAGENVKSLVPFLVKSVDLFAMVIFLFLYQQGLGRSETHHANHRQTGSKETLPEMGSGL